MADAPAKKKSNLMTILSFAIVFMVILDPKLRELTGNVVGIAFNPVFGFGGAYPVLTIMLVGTVMVLATTTLRHFTTDWLEQAKFQSYMRSFQKELGEARKANNTYKLKILQDKQMDLLKKQQEVQGKMLKNMPMTMIVVIPIFAWLFGFVSGLEFPYFTAPWNHAIDMFATNGILFGSSLFPHWILLYMTLSIPLGALVQKTMKYISWKERWQDVHPDVHEAEHA